MIIRKSRRCLHQLLLPPIRTFSGSAFSTLAPAADSTTQPTLPASPLVTAITSSATFEKNSHCFSVYPMALSVINTACCWSVLILLFLSNNSIGGRRFRQNYLGSSFFIPTTTTGMSSYSAIFADAFHPLTSNASKDSESENKDTSTAGKSNDNNDGTCNANNNNDNNDEESTDGDESPKGKPHPEADGLHLFHFDSTPSTQDEAKKIAKLFSSSSLSSSVPQTFCVTATSQSNGRGTTGRQWLGAPGNVFVTIGIPVKKYVTTMLKERNIPLTLLPLKIGDLTASLVQTELTECKQDNAVVTVKWPNDVLVDGKKISGTLIESSDDWFLIGIGINIAHSPLVPTTGTDYGRPSTSLNNYGCCQDCNAQDLGVKLAMGFHEWIHGGSETTAERIVEGWKQWLDWGTELTIRNDADKTQIKKVVKLLDVLPDGRIRVQDKNNGKEEVLVSDYFV